MPQLTVDKKQLFDAIGPFVRLQRINRDFGHSPDEPIRSFAPGIWPTYGDLLKLAELANKLGWKP